jgi:hypothetical protein
MSRSRRLTATPQARPFNIDIRAIPSSFEFNIETIFSQAIPCPSLFGSRSSADRATVF